MTQVAWPDEKAYEEGKRGCEFPGKLRGSKTPPLKLTTEESKQRDRGLESDPAGAGAAS
jgi:hypothetical protein